MIQDTLSDAIRQIDAQLKAHDTELLRVGPKGFEEQLWIVVTFMDALREALAAPEDEAGLTRAHQLLATIRDGAALCDRLEAISTRTDPVLSYDWEETVRALERSLER